MLANEKERILYEIAAIQSLADLAMGDPVMELPFQQKIEELRLKLADAEHDEPEARAVIYFFGDPVKGTLGIEAGFLGDTLAPFQQLVSARVSKNWRLNVRKKGKIKDLNDSTLYLTSLPRGSFGVELKKLTNVHMAHESHLSESLRDVVLLIDAARSEETFAEVVGNSSPRELSAMRKWFASLKKNNAGVALETGELHTEFSIEEVRSAYAIISKTDVDFGEVEIIGRFRGVLLDSRTYDFVDNSGTLIKGPVSDELTEDELEEFNKELLDIECIGIFEKTITGHVGEEGKPVFTLKSLEAR